jgi:hypothetical protein
MVYFMGQQVKEVYNSDARASFFAFQASILKAVKMKTKKSLYGRSKFT